MASKTALVDLPNELFGIIFQYLSSIDLLNAFSKLSSRRFQVLLQSDISKLDISQESIEWIEMHIQDLFANYNLIALRLQMRDLAFIAKYLLSTSIKCIEIVKWDFDYSIPSDLIVFLRQNMKQLTFSIPELDEDNGLSSQLFVSDSQLEHLSIYGCVLYLDVAHLEEYPRLTHLSVELDGMQPVYVLMNYLPNLQELKVKIRSQECFVQSAPDTYGVKPCQTLRSVTFTGWIKYFDHLKSFFTSFGSTIEYLFLNIECRYHKIDGRRLEHGLLDQMPQLSSLNLIISSSLTDNEPIHIETFQSLLWQKFNPVVYWMNRCSQQHTIFTIPYRSNHFHDFSNDFASTWVSNRPITLSFNHVRTLSLIAATTITLETCRLMQKIFPNITAVELIHEMVDSLIEDEDEVEDKLAPPFLTEDLLENVTVQFPFVTKLSIYKWSEVDDYRTFQRVLGLFPNLAVLKLDVEQRQFYEVLQHKYENDFVQNVLARIKRLEITLDNSIRMMTDKQIKYLFPNAQRLIKRYDSRG